MSCIRLHYVDQSIAMLYNLDNSPRTITMGDHCSSSSSSSVLADWYCNKLDV